MLFDFLKKIFGATRRNHLVPSDEPLDGTAEISWRNANAHLANDLLPEAIAGYRDAILYAPDVSAYRVALGFALMKAQMPDDATAVLLNAIDRGSKDPDAHYLLGSLAEGRGNDDIAVANFRAALALDATLVPAYIGLTAALFRTGELGPALATVERGLEEFPDNEEFQFYRANVLAEMGDLDAAVHGYEKALAVRPGYAEALANLSHCQRQQGKIEISLTNLRRAIELQPGNPAWHSNLLLTLQYGNSLSPQDLFAEHVRFAELFEKPLRISRQKNKAAQARIKIGYVSGDFRHHSLAYFIAPVLRHHNRATVEVYCYYTHPVHDTKTRQLQGLADVWRSCAKMSDDAMAQQIRDDGIDILIDLSGHTGYNRLLVFARKPAAVQMTWLGYQSTTGLSAMDYRITDYGMDPPGQTEIYHTEKLLRLDIGAVFQPDPSSPPVNTLPSLSSDTFTFACFNNLAKITPQFIDAASRILHGSSAARLVLGNMTDESRSEMVHFFSLRGIGPDRLQLLPKMSLTDYLRAHHIVDLGLDTFPYNGGTTTIHSLWMGVPVLALKGNMPVSRVGDGLMRGIGLGQFSCDGLEGYVEQALAWIDQRQELQKIRQELRARMSSAMMDRAQYLTSELEARFKEVCPPDNSTGKG